MQYPTTCFHENFDRLAGLGVGSRPCGPGRCFYSLPKSFPVAILIWHYRNADQILPATKMNSVVAAVKTMTSSQGSGCRSTQTSNDCHGGAFRGL
jgi:hypothetical protein